MFWISIILGILNLATATAENEQVFSQVWSNSMFALLMQICSVQWDVNGCLWGPQVLGLVLDIQGLLIDSNYRTWWLSVNVGWLLTSTDTNYLSSLNIFNTATSRVFYLNPSREIICNILNMLSSEDVRMCHCIGMPWIIPLKQELYRLLSFY